MNLIPHSIPFLQAHTHLFYHLTGLACFYSGVLPAFAMSCLKEEFDTDLISFTQNRIELGAVVNQGIKT